LNNRRDPIAMHSTSSSTAYQNPTALLHAGRSAALPARGRNWRVETDTLCPAEWDAVLSLFTDAMIQQSSAYGRGQWGESTLSHLLLRDGSRIVGAAQLVLRTLPSSGPGIAHLKFGPLWRRCDSEADPAILRRLLAALRDEYAGKRGLVLRIKPWVSPDDRWTTAAIRDAGFRYKRHLPHYDTLMLDLRHSVEELHRSLKPRWRANLRKGMRHEYRIERQEGSAAVARFMDLYRQMSERKRFYDSSESDAFPDIYAAMPASLRPDLLFCYYRDDPVAAAVISHAGKNAFYWFGATNRLALDRHLSYVLHWQVLLHLKARGCRWYDLAGVSQPGVYQFKSGLAGRLGQRLAMGDYDACSSPLLNRLIDTASALRKTYRDWRIRLAG
jgi:lipid II:glycine glycyltransferase (peptidoglycan interpeptide bridge formation enzyme)